MKKIEFDEATRLGKMEEKELAVRLLAARDGLTIERATYILQIMGALEREDLFLLAAEAARIAKDARVSALEEVAAIVKYNDAHVLFAAGEMTSGELSAVRAILKIKHSAIQRLIDAETAPK